MVDIVERLRKLKTAYEFSKDPYIGPEAASKIEQLREALKKICHVTGSDMEAYDIAENALKEKE